jgi:hypothetical protein
MNLVMRLLKASRNHSLVGRTLLKKRSLIVSDGGSLGLGPETAGEGYKLGYLLVHTCLLFFGKDRWNVYGQLAKLISMVSERRGYH